MSAGQGRSKELHAEADVRGGKQHTTRGERGAGITGVLASACSLGGKRHRAGGGPTSIGREEISHTSVDLRKKTKKLAHFARKNLSIFLFLQQESQEGEVTRARAQGPSYNSNGAGPGGAKGDVEMASFLRRLGRGDCSGYQKRWPRRRK